MAISDLALLLLVQMTVQFACEVLLLFFSLFILISFSLSVQESLSESSSLTVVVSAFPLFSVFAAVQICAHIQVEGSELQARSAACCSLATSG